jgi:hypothetical protein
MTSKRGYVDYSYIDSSSRFKSGETITGNIQKYRWWWRYLKLCLELEDKKIRIKGQRIKVSRRFYKKWNIDQILSSSFDDWWKDHRYLFIEEQVQRLSSSEKIDSDYLYLKIPKDRKELDLIREVKYQLKNQLVDRTIKFPFSDSPVPLIRLHIQYNCLVMSINDHSRLEIMDWCNDKYKDIQGVIQNKEMSERVVFGYEQSVSRVVSKGRDTLISCSSKEGIFP